MNKMIPAYYTPEFTEKRELVFTLENALTEGAKRLVSRGDLECYPMSTVSNTYIKTYQDFQASVSEYIYMQVQELATFLGYLGHSLVMGSGTLRIIIDPWQRRMRSERYMSLEKAVSLYNQRSNSYAYRGLTPIIKRRVTQYPNTSLKLDIQRNSKCKYGLCSSLLGGVPAK